MFTRYIRNFVLFAFAVCASGCGWLMDDDSANFNEAQKPPKRYSIDGRLTGLSEGQTLIIQLEDSAGAFSHTATLNANGRFTLRQLRKGAEYFASVKSHPKGQNCSIRNDSVTIIRDETPVVLISCVAERYTLGGSSIGNISGISLTNTISGEQLVVPAGADSFAFKETLASGERYSVVISTVSDGQSCSLTSSDGVADGSPVELKLNCAPKLPAVPNAPSDLAIKYDAKSYSFSWSSSPAAITYELAEDPDGAGPQAQTVIRSSIAEARYTYLFNTLLHLRLNAQYRVRACNSGGCSAFSEPITPDVTKAIGYIKASNSQAGAEFGFLAVKLSADGTTLVVGAAGESSGASGVNGNQNDTSAPGAGAVYVYTKDGGTWSQQAYLKASNASSGGLFGLSVALSGDGNTLAVSALGEASNAVGINGDQADKSAPDSGAVYIFTRTNSSWRQQSYLKASNTRAAAGFGTYLSLTADGSTLAVGAWQESSNAVGINGDQSNTTAPNAGAVYVFTNSAGLWRQDAYIKPSNTLAGFRFGQRLALADSGDTLVVGAVREPSNATGVNGNQSNTSSGEAGAVYVFGRVSGDWQQQAYLKASNTNTANAADAGDRFGIGLALSADGDTLAIGAWREDSRGQGINALQNDEGAAESGAVYVFTRAGQAWSQQSYIKSSNSRAGDFFGNRVALSADGNVLAVSSYGQDGGALGVGGDQENFSSVDSGAVYVFNRAAGLWSQKVYLKSSNSRANDLFGWGLALSADGKTLAVGAPFESSNATGVGGSQADASASKSGAVYVY
jgi:hypothetical protein